MESQDLRCSPPTWDNDRLQWHSPCKGIGQGRLFRGTDICCLEWYLLAMIKITRKLSGKGNMMSKDRYEQAKDI